MSVRYCELNLPKERNRNKTKTIKRANGYPSAVVDEI